MMRHYLFCVVLIFVGCDNNNKMQSQIDDLTVQLANSYKPGFGEFMSSVQVHHAKLWFAGKNKNWKLAEFELNEITESLEAIQKYQTERPESKAIPILSPALDSVRIAVQQQDVKLFAKTFTTLTATCNTCHRAVKFEFTVVKVPDSPPFSNQDFSVLHQ